MSRRKPGFGKQLADLHRWNGWIVLLLAVTGLLLPWDVVRGWLDGHFRNPVKQLHIILGVLSAVILFLYIPLMKKHLKQIKKRTKQKGNLGFMVILLVGWLLSGIILWQIRRFPPQWANGAIIAHDLLTWIGVPYIIFHSLTRLKWMKKPERRSIKSSQAEDVIPTRPNHEIAAHSNVSYTERSPWINRRQFLKWSVGAALTVSVAPSFFRWMTTSFGGTITNVTGTTKDIADDANLMLPNPTPLPDSVNVIGGGAKGYFRVYSVTPLPTFDSKTWKFSIDGLVDIPSAWNWESFIKMARTVQVSDFHCVTGWSVYKNTWEGIPLSVMLKQAGLKPSAKFVKFYSGDGVYTDTLTLEQADMEDVLVAVLHDGKPIHRDYGGPVRLIVPKMYAYKSVKWLNRIELIDKDHIGYWEERGYDTDAWVKT
ncbi:molybdopterin-dependent oxidoreductase [Cohnella lupini]|uniref:DMSO/TMAO reductase YedYZ molybdopterin-dependent catalytic subunit n=1 Tax=Cohnella lupini TaxID=1294267 RepID=A0A3D9I095_9BACL|nr:molybdopterin-dependent oxidoreductase [Cohnella lupini]RED55105.1 DMSO/TMAO reductase YedYZ molybdopterin-dependent catalytic subunit [Cohnella lupini]